MSKRGTTLIETVISIFLISVVVVTLLESLNVGITGTLNLSRKTSALNLAKSQMEFVKAQKYNASTGDISDSGVYRSIMTGENISDRVNYNISGQVSDVSVNQSLQLVTVNVSYLHGKQVQLTGYKAARESLSSPPAKGNIVNDVVEDMPFLQPGGWALGCVFSSNTSESSCGTYTGYYHVFTTSQSGYISATWKFDWVNELYGTVDGWWTWGAPYIGIYNGTPPWVNRDYQGNVEQDGVIFRPGLGFNGGCMPNANASSCDCDISGDSAPIVMNPASCGANWCVYVENNWNYEKPLYDCALWLFTALQSGSYEFSVTTPTAKEAGTYTVLFFNGEDRISYQTVSASVTYVY
jgi:Tfp pilus assembly protein PilV